MVVITRSGKVSRQRIERNESNQDGHTFHPNNSAFFADQGRFYLLAFASRNYKPSLFEWNGKRYNRLPIVESDRLLTAYKLSGRIAQQVDMVDQILASNGWRKAYSQLTMETDTFVWGTNSVMINVTKKPEEIIISIDIKDLNGFEPLSMTYPSAVTRLTEDEFRALPKEEPPHRR